jgi:FKBP-type peptidyl-prolyl cis-trans isomerase
MSEEKNRVKLPALRATFDMSRAAPAIVSVEYVDAETSQREWEHLLAEQAAERARQAENAAVDRARYAAEAADAQRQREAKAQQEKAAEAERKQAELAERIAQATAIAEAEERARLQMREQWEKEKAAAASASESDAAESRGEPAKRPPQAQAEQERIILEIIRSLGHDPKALPCRACGKRGVKSEVKGLVPQWMQHGKVFDKAWERLRANEEIQGGN